jgi:hypothetical protein
MGSLFGMIFAFIFLIVIFSIFCRRSNGGRFRPRRVRKNKKRVLYVFIDPSNPNNVIYCRYSKKTGKYKQVQYNLMVDQYAEVSTVQMQMNYDPNLNFAPPNYTQQQPQNIIPPNGVQPNYGQQYYGQQNPGANNYYANQANPGYNPNPGYNNPNVYGQQDIYAPTNPIANNTNNLGQPLVYGNQPY